MEDADIEETIFQRNVPGRYSRWTEEHDDRRNDEEDNGDGDELDVDREDPSASIPSGENVNVMQRLQESALPDHIKASILAERMERHSTGVKGVLADHKAIKALERAERDMREAQRQEVLQRIVTGAKASPATGEDAADPNDKALDDDDDDDDDEDDAFMELYRAKRRQELLNASSLPVFGSVVEVEASTFVDEVERVDSRVAVVVHLYETGVQASIRMNRFLEELAATRKNIKFLRMNASMNEMEVDRMTLPVLSVYRGGKVVEVIAGFAVEYGDFFALHDVEHALDKVLDHC